MLWSRWKKITSMRGVYVSGRIAQYTTQGKYRIFVYFISVNLFHPYSHSLICSRYIALKQWCITHTNTNSLAMIPTYSKILSIIEKVLQDLIEEY